MSYRDMAKISQIQKHDRPTETIRIRYSIPRATQYPT